MIKMNTKQGTPMKQLLSLMLLASTSLFSAESADAPRPSLVTTVALEKGSVNPLQNFVGTLYYDKQSRLASEIEGVVERLLFREGQKVRKGEILVQLDSKVLQANARAKASALEALKAELTRVERDLKRAKALLERDSISQSSYDQSFYAAKQLHAQAAAMRSELDALNIQLEKSRIKSPFDAVVTARYIEVGEWVGKGSAVATLVATDTLEARLNIPARLIETLRSNTRFTASIGDRDIDVTLKSVIPVADAATRTFPVELDVPESTGLIEGMRIDVKVPTLKESEALLIPRDAVIKRFGQTVVFAAVDGKAVMLPVQVIGYKHDLAAIAGAGLQEQMRIVTKGNERIFPNMPVMEKKGK